MKICLEIGICRFVNQIILLKIVIRDVAIKLRYKCEICDLLQTKLQLDQGCEQKKTVGDCSSNK